MIGTTSRLTLPSPFRLAAALAALACQNVAPPAQSFELPEPYTCVEDADCGDARCDLELGECVTDDVGYQQLLLQIVPENTELQFGGGQYYQPITMLNSSPSLLARLDVPVPVPLKGRLTPYYAEGSGNCALDLKVTFIPHESFLGLSTIQYTAIAKRDWEDYQLKFVNVFEFGSIPVGTYDIYWQDAGTVTQTENRSHLCEVVPQLIRNQQINQASELIYEQPTPDSVRVEVPWQDDLEGWRVDVIHPVTGQVVSTERTLERACPDDPLRRWREGKVCAPVQETTTGELVAVASLRYANIGETDYGSPDQELLRLRPPPGVHRPATYFVLLPLIAVEGGPAQVPGPIETFASQRRLEVWAWEEGNPQHPVAGRVEFVAQALSAEPDTVYSVRFKRNVPIEDDGRVTVDLPPGNYLARVYPVSGSTSIYETSVTVWGASDGRAAGDTQAGRVLVVPPGSTVRGRVHFPGGLSPEGAQVWLSGRSSRPGVLSEGLLTARGQTTLVEADGRFEFLGADCRTCDGANGLAYSLRVLPPHGMGLPWLVLPSVGINGPNDNVGDIALSFPRHHFGLLGIIRSNGRLDPFKGPPLIRAYLLLGRDGNPVPSTTRSCTVAREDAAPCAQRAVEVAQDRAAADGTFELRLPPWPTTEPASVVP